MWTLNVDSGWVLSIWESQNYFISQVEKMLFLAKVKETYICEGGDTTQW